jgi:predicted negative regulator of RcsB-dependent stress response
VSEFSEEEQWERTKAFFKTHAIWIIGGIAIGLAGLKGWNWYQDRKVAQAETASTRYQELIDAFARNDRTRGTALVEELNSKYSWTPYASLGTLLAAKHYVDANELDKATASLKSVVETAPETEIRLIARTRLARVQAAQGKYDEALATLAVEDVGEFAPRFADTRGDVLLAKGDRAGALKEYLTARGQSEEGRMDIELLDLKIRDLGGTPPADGAAEAS